MYTESYIIIYFTEMDASKEIENELLKIKNSSTSRSETVSLKSGNQAPPKQGAHPG